MDLVVVLVAFAGALSGWLLGWFAGSSLARQNADYWESRARELEGREQGHLQTILKLKQAGHELPPEEPPYEPPYVITDEFSARVHEEREGKSRTHEELVRRVIEEGP